MKNYFGFILNLVIINIAFSQMPCILGDVYVGEAANKGDPEDYIEVYNGGSFECTLGGFQLDDSEDLEDFTFGDVILAPGDFWLGYEDDDDSFGSGLGGGGDIVVFADADGNMLTVTLEESIEIADGTELSQSYGSDGTGCYTLPTPGESNAECFEFIYGCTDPDASNYNADANLDDDSCEYPAASCILGDVYVGEAANKGDPEDYIEVYNGGSFECTLGGFQLDDSEDLEDFTFGDVILAPGDFWLGYEDDDDSFGSGLGGGGDIVVFADADGNMLTVTLEESIEIADGTELSQSYGSDGTGCYTLPTPGESNAECFEFIYGCTDPDASNYNANANLDDDSCEYLMPGDINADGEINVLDVVQLVGFILGTSNPSDTQIASGDLNGDGVLNVLDVVALVNIILDS